MSCHGRETGLGSKIGVRKQKGVRGRKEGTGSCHTSRKEEEKEELIKRDMLKRELEEGERRGREREGELCALITLPGTLPTPPLGLTLGKHQAKAWLCGAGQDHLSPQLPSKSG